MKYADLNEYKQYLQHSRGLAKSTAQKYYNHMEKLSKGQNLINGKMDMEKVLEEFRAITYKNDFSKSKNALLYYFDFKNVHLDEHLMTKLEEMERNTKKKYRKLPKREFKKIDQTIKHLKNDKLKLSYQTLLETGLRVSELSQLTPTNCKVDSDKITFTFIAKGGNKENAILIKKENEFLYSELKEKIERTSPIRKIFYSSNYLQQKATTYGFCCHDLRRTCAKLEYKKTKSKDSVQKKLRHSSAKTTNIYLKSKIKM